MQHPFGIEFSAAGLSEYAGPAPGWTFYPYDNFDASVPGNQSVISRLKWHFDRALVSAPQERYSFFASGKYDFTDKVRFFSRATMAESETETVLFGTNAIFGWEGTVQFNPTTDSPINPALNYQDTARRRCCDSQSGCLREPELHSHGGTGCPASGSGRVGRPAVGPPRQSVYACE